MGKATVLYSQHLLDSQSFEFLICILQALNVPLIHCTNIFFPNEAIPSHMYLALQVAGFPFTDILYGSKHTEELFFRNKLFHCDLYQTKLLSKLLSGIISIFILTGLDLVKSAIGCTLGRISSGRIYSQTKMLTHPPRSTSNHWQRSGKLYIHQVCIHLEMLVKWFIFCIRYIV